MRSRKLSQIILSWQTFSSAFILSASFSPVSLVLSNCFYYSSRFWMLSYCHVIGVVTIRRGMDWMIGFIDTLHTHTHTHQSLVFYTLLLQISLYYSTHKDFTVALSPLNWTRSILPSSANYQLWNSQSNSLLQLPSLLIYPHRAQLSTDHSESESESCITTDGQSTSLSWNKAPIWDLRLDFYYCQTVAGVLMWGALSDERRGLSFARVTGSRQRSHSRNRVPWNSWPYFTVSDSRLPFSSPPTTLKATPPHGNTPLAIGGWVGPGADLDDLLNVYRSLFIPYFSLSLLLPTLTWNYCSGRPRGRSSSLSMSKFFAFS
jgi:hypothetical protein